MGEPRVYSVGRRVLPLLIFTILPLLLASPPALAQTNTTATTAGVGGGIQALAAVLALIALFAPVIAYYSRWILGFTAALASGVSLWIDTYMMGVAEGAEEALWHGLAVLSLVSLILSLIIVLMKLIAGLGKPRLKSPRLEPLGI